ncbi:MAG: T9SS type A sorting domain-containing protein, partial [Chlorobi bacterium]|nr:T9SS type A sorting domain-containing protein [Chlorobiota bacterium]
AAEVNLSIYNAAGELVTMPMNAFKSAGEHTAELHAENLSAGTYFCTISYNGRTETVKLVLVK